MTALLSDLTPGTRVRVINAGHLSGKTGVVVGEPLPHTHDFLPVYDIAVLLDKETDRDPIAALGFYVHELAVTK